MEKLIIDTYEKLIKVHNVLRKYILNRNKKYVLCSKVKCFLNLKAEIDTPVFVLLCFKRVSRLSF